MDHLTKEQRHKNMMANKSRGTKIELLLGRMMWNAGIRYRKNDKSLPGTPDFSIRKARVAVFCDGEFWHGHNWEERKHDIKSNRDFWYAKIERNIERDKKVNQQLYDMGWKVFRFWEDEIRREPERCMRDVSDYIHMVANNHISPSATYGSACNQLNLYGPHSYNRDGSIMSVNDQMAVVSHYLHTYGQSSAEAFAHEADGLIDDICEDSCCTSVCEEDVRTSLYNNTFTAPFPPPLHPRFTFIDLCAGIGGMRLGMQLQGGRCVFASEWDAMAARQYFVNFGEAPFGDITKEETKTYIPAHFDLLCASLPLQAFALMHRRNVMDKIQGTLFAETADIIRRRMPQAVLIELPASQLTLNGGRYTDVIKDVLSKELGYTVIEPRVTDASGYSLAQHREYMFMIAFACAAAAEKFVYPESSDSSKVFSDVIETDAVSARYYLSETSVNTRNDSLSLTPCNEKVTLTGNTVVTDRRTIDMLPSTHRLDRINRQGIRRITPREHARLNGFPDTYDIVLTDNRIHLMLKSASCVNVISALARSITACLDLKEQTFRYGSK